MGTYRNILNLSVESCKRLSESIETELLPKFEKDEEQRFLHSLINTFGLEINRKILEKQNAEYRSKFSLLKEE